VWGWGGEVRGVAQDGAWPGSGERGITGRDARRRRERAGKGGSSERECNRGGERSRLEQAHGGECL